MIGCNGTPTCAETARTQLMAVLKLALSPSVDRSPVASRHVLLQNVGSANLIFRSASLKAVNAFGSWAAMPWSQKSCPRNRDGKLHKSLRASRRACAREFAPAATKCTSERWTSWSSGLIKNSPLCPLALVVALAECECQTPANAVQLLSLAIAHRSVCSVLSQE